MSTSNLVSLPGATVLLTGATGGIGGAIARALAERGAKLVLSGRREDELRAAAEALGARALVADLAVRDDVDRLAREAGEVDVLVANAALPASGLLSELTREQIDRMLEVNLHAPIVLARELAGPMVARGRGQIVLISSLAGKAASPASSIYSATKFGLRGFGLALRQDLAAQGVGVSVITPGFIRDAGMFHDAGVRLPRGIGTRTPAEVAAAVVRAIEENRAERDVATVALRAAALVGAVAPGLAEQASRRFGGAEVARQLVVGQVDKR